MSATSNILSVCFGVVIGVTTRGVRPCLRLAVSVTNDVEEPVDQHRILNLGRQQSTVFRTRTLEVG